MPKYLFVYHGGGMPDSEEEGNRQRAAWGEWLGGMGKDVVDGGSPVGQSSTVERDGSVAPHGGLNPTSGYGIVMAKDLDDALAKAKGCPILSSGGSVEVAETFAP